MHTVEPDAPTPKTVPSKIKGLFSTLAAAEMLKVSEFSIFH